jgi:hypothetical protein
VFVNLSRHGKTLVDVVLAKREVEANNNSRSRIDDPEFLL